MKARSSESRVPWVLMGLAFYGQCGDRVVEERGGPARGLRGAAVLFPR
ncbi:hypothetical protein [Infirmifilum sp. NZ]|nr:hypothetical protein [Infirmifilum sp. NZ]UNQ74252.1 hypothetical protein MOV14_04385 [Infirmifilum sp. NZ]